MNDPEEKARVASSMLADSLYEQISTAFGVGGNNDPVMYLEIKQSAEATFKCPWPGCAVETDTMVLSRISPEIVVVMPCLHTLDAALLSEMMQISMNG